MVIIAVKQRIDDPCIFDTIMMDTCHNLHVFPIENPEFIEEVCTGRHPIVPIDKDMSIEKFVKGFYEFKKKEGFPEKQKVDFSLEVDPTRTWMN